jgi:hypothetical protein
MGMTRWVPTLGVADAQQTPIEINVMQIQP